MGHTISTLAIAIVFWLAGAGLAQHYGHLVSALSSIALVVFGGWIALGSLATFASTTVLIVTRTTATLTLIDTKASNIATGTNTTKRIGTSVPTRRHRITITLTIRRREPRCC